MTDNPMTNIRQLPIYKDAFAAGVDLGTRQALDAIEAERDRQDWLSQSLHAGSNIAARHAYASAILLGVARTVARHFRQ